MMDVRTGLEIALMILVSAAVLYAVGRGLGAAERRGWIRLHGTGKVTISVAGSRMTRRQVPKSSTLPPGPLT